jgi:hypothetical protein
MEYRTAERFATRQYDRLTNFTGVRDGSRGFSTE